MLIQKSAKTVRNIPVCHFSRHPFAIQSGNVCTEVSEQANWQFSEPLLFYSRRHGLQKWHPKRLPIVIADINFVYPGLLMLSNIISCLELRIWILNVMFFRVLPWTVRIMQKSEDLARTMNGLSALTVVMLIPERN